MKATISKNTRCSRSSVRRAGFFSALFLVFGIQPSVAATLGGIVASPDGQPLYRVPICLKTDTSESDCVRVRKTDRQGQYQFNGLKTNTSYTVEVFQDSSAAGRKFEEYRTYVWEPKAQGVATLQKSERLQLETFIGKFNFSNFQRVVTLTAADFPELSSLDLTSEYVALKVFVPSTDAESSPETIFLGQVTNLDILLIEASVPLAASAIGYQIYSATLSLDGSIILADG
jgi:hypothetical protein